MSDIPETYSLIEKQLQAYLQTLKTLKALHYRLAAFDMDGKCRYSMCGHCKVEFPCMTMEMLGAILDEYK